MNGHLIGLDEQYMSIDKILKKTAENGENSAILMLGPPKTGKTELIDLLISNHQNEKWKVIRLDGLCHASEDSHAWKKMLRDCGLLEESKQQFKSFAGALNLLLSKVDEESKEEEEENENKLLLFVLDNFDLFATLPKRQTLLYTLFNDLIRDTRHSHISVVALTHRFDTSELLEKRVRSRFTPQVIEFYPLQTFELISQVIQNKLIQLTSHEEGGNILPVWNDEIQQLCATVEFEEFWKEVMKYDLSIPYFEIILMNATEHWREKGKKKGVFLTVKDLKYGRQIFMRDDMIHSALFNRTSLEFGLIVTMSILENRKRITEYDFTVVFDHWDSFAKKYFIEGRISKESAFKSFENLIFLGLVECKGRVKTHTMKQHLHSRITVTEDQIVYAAKHYDYHTKLTELAIHGFLE